MMGIDIFAGAGGLSLGATLAGIEVTAAVECDARTAKTYRYNLPSVKLMNDRVENVHPDLRSIMAAKPLIVFGGPPCQGFSIANQRTRNEENSANWLYREFLRVVRSLRPEWALLENVAGILQTSGGTFLSRILDALRRAGYAVTWWLLDASRYGVPQVRNRLFIIGSRSGALPTPPAESGFRRTVRDAIADLPYLANGALHDKLPYRSVDPSDYATALRAGADSCYNHLVSNNSPGVVRRYGHVPQGGNWRSIPAHLMRNYRDRSRCHTGIYRRVQWDAPSVVIGNFRKNMLIHPSQNRGLSVREAARLQSFPDSYRFIGSIGFQQQQVGNAVPPLLAKAVFSRILSM